MFHLQVGVLRPWGSGTWGSAAAANFANQLRLWSHDAFGEDLLSTLELVVFTIGIHQAV